VKARPIRKASKLSAPPNARAGSARSPATRKDVAPKEAIFDQELIAITNAVAAADDATSLAGVKAPAPMRTVLEDAAPVYRKVWWERH